MSTPKRILNCIAIFFIVALLTTCTYDKEGPPLPENGYPENIAKIFVVKCATPGCHNTQSKNGAGGFDLSTWDHLFEGGRNGSSVIPFLPDQSFLTYFINTYSDLGISIQPIMPYDANPLSHDEVVMVKDWIRNGAPDKNGNIKFCCDPGRKKFYVTNQGCDIVTVFDSKTRLPMRIVDVGTSSSQIESPHAIAVSPDGNYWYIVFLYGNTPNSQPVMQKFRTSDDSLVGEALLGPGQWTSMTISSDSHYAFAVDFLGSVALIDLQSMTKTWTYHFSYTPHGCAISPDFQRLYVTSQYGNYIYRFDLSDMSNIQEDDIKLEAGPQVYISKLDPHQIAVSPDGTKYYVSCQRTNEIRVMSVAMDTLLAVIPTGVFPQELEFSTTRPYLFVSCMNDSVTNPGLIGSVSVINYQTNTFIKSIYTGWQPHGMKVDDNSGYVYVANRNVNPNGDAPHHTSTCGGRNGYITIIDMNALDPMDMDLLDYKIEVSVDPYEIGIRK